MLLPTMLSIMKAIKTSQAIILGETCIFSKIYIKDLFDRMEKEMDSLSCTDSAGHGQFSDLHSSNELKVAFSSAQYTELKEVCDDGGSSKCASEKGPKKKRGKLTGSLKAGTLENDPDNQESIPPKTKKNQRRTKDTSSSNVSDTKSGSKKGSDKVKEDNLNAISEEWIMQRILALAPDLGDLGGSEDLVGHLSSHLRPMLLDSWKKRRNTLLLENAEGRRRLLDNLQKQLDEVFLDMQLYEKALDLFEDDSSTSVILHKHLLKSSATSIVDKILLTLDMDNKMKNGVEVANSESLESTTLSSMDRISLAKSLPGSLSVKAQVVVEALEGKRMDTFMTALRALAEESGLLLKKLDKKLERALLHSYRKALTSQISSEADPVVLLPKVIALLYLQVYNKALQAPGRAISAAVLRLKEKIPDPTYKVLMDYHSATVTLLALQSAATEDEEDCTSDRILSQKELLESKMPELKGLVLNTGTSN